MCIALPVRLVEVRGGGTAPTGVAELGDRRIEVSLAFVPEARTGSYVIAHSGVALAVVDEREAAARLRLGGEVFAPDAARRVR